MKVLHITCSLSRNAGGLFFSVRSLARELVALGVDVSVIAPHDEFTAVDAQKWVPVDVRSYPVLGPSSLGYSDGVQTMVGSPDIQHIHGIWMYHSRVNRKAAQTRGIPYLISPRGMLDPWAVQNSGWKKKIAGLLYEYRHLRDAHCIHALCESEADSIRKFGLKNPICVIPNAIDLPIAAVEHRPDSKCPQKKNLLFLGRIHPKKGLSLLLRAVSEIPSVTRSRWMLQIAGWDQNHQAELETLATDLGLRSDVSFIGPHFGDEKHLLYKSCDAFVLPSLSEGLPMSVLEAWSYGKPAIITSTCNLPEGALAGAAIECAADVESLKAALLQLFSLNLPERNDMGNRGRELVASKFTWPVVSRQMLDVYDWLMNRRDVPKTVRLD